jgi:hypothetical protein
MLHLACTWHTDSDPNFVASVLKWMTSPAKLYLLVSPSYLVSSSHSFSACKIGLRLMVVFGVAAS